MTADEMLLKARQFAQMGTVVLFAAVLFILLQLATGAGDGAVQFR